MAKYFILSFLFAIMVFTACNKKATPSAASMTDILRNGRWKVTSGTLSVKLPDGKDTMLNYLNWIPACHQGDYFVFHAPTTGAVFNATPCNPGDPDSVSFTWELTNNNTCLSINSSDHLYYSVQYTVLLPFGFDTLSIGPPLVLDTIHGVYDTAAGYTRSVIVLDTLWQLGFDTAAVPNTNIYNAPITNFSQSAFTLNFSLLSYYFDTTNHHTGMYIDASSDTIDYNPIVRPDTFKYTVTFSNE